jgi:putative ABC transport system substrate-binding protein
MLAAKRLELLREFIPRAATIGVLVNPTTAAAELQTRDLLEGARGLALTLHILNARNIGELDEAFATLVQVRADALLMTDSPLFNSRREQLVTLAARHAVPAIYTFREFAAVGGLMSYAASLADAHRQLGIYVGRILKGEKPSDLPVLQPTRFELVLNLKTAKALGLDIPAKLLALADEVIE